MIRWLVVVLLLAAACSTSSLPAAQPGEQSHAVYLDNGLAEPLREALREFLEGDAAVTLQGSSTGAGGDADCADGSAAVRSGVQPRGEARMDVIPK